MRWRDEQPQRLPRAEAGDLCGHDHHAHPKLRTGSFFPDDIVERYQRVDRAFVAAMAVMYATGASTRKVARVAETFPSVESLERLAGGGDVRRGRGVVACARISSSSGSNDLCQDFGHGIERNHAAIGIASGLGSGRSKKAGLGSVRSKKSAMASAGTL